MEVKRLLILLGLTILCFRINPQTTSQIPGGTDNYLQLSNQLDAGALDAYAVIFYEIPQTVTSPLYFGIYDPDFYFIDPGGVSPYTPTAEDSSSEHIAYGGPAIAGAGATFTLVGGTGTLSHPGSRLVDYAVDGDDPLAPGLGTILSQFVNTNTASDDGWVYFAMVDPEQGELIGNKRYFKVVAQVVATTSWVKNGFKVDISLNGSGNPTGVSGVKAFAYSWPVYLKNTNTWDLYPFVPDSAIGDDMIFYNWDLDGSETLAAFDKDETVLTSPGISGNSTVKFTDAITGIFPGITAGESNGSWHLLVTENDIGGPGDSVNLSEFWFANQLWDGITVKDGVYRTYSIDYDDPPAAADIFISSADGAAIADNTDTETVVIQVVNAADDPAPYSRNIWIETSGNAIIGDANSFYPGYTAGSASALIVTNGEGIGWVTIHDGTTETVTVTAAVNGTTVPGNDANEANLSAVVHTIPVDFQDNPEPLISSSGNLTFYSTDTAPALDLKDIVITEVGASSISSGAGNIIIRIPAGLSVQFDTAGGDPVFSGDVAVSGFTRYADRLEVNPATNFTAGQTMVISGLRFDPAGDSPSSGKLELTVNGGATPILDDKVVKILDPNPTFIWDGSDNANWDFDANWLGGTAPSAATDNIVIPFSGVINMPVLNTAAVVNTLSLSKGAVLNLAGFGLTVNSSFSNEGRLILQGGETVTLSNGLDTNSGLVEYNGGGVYTGLALGNSYFNLLFSGAGSWDLTAALSVNGDMSLSAGTLDVAADYGITIGGDWDSTGGTFLSGAGTILMNGSGTFKGTGAFWNLGLDTAGTITLAGNINVDGDLTITNGTLDAESYDIELAGNWSNNGGSFIAGTGTVTFNGAGILANDESFYDVIIASTYTLNINGNALSLESGGSFDNRGFLYRTGGGGENAPPDINSGRVVYQGAGGTIEDYNASPLADYNDLEIGGTGTFVVEAASTLTTAGDIFITGGTLGTNTCDLEAGRIICESVLDASPGGDITVSGDVDLTTGSFSKGSGTFSFSGGTSKNLTANSQDLGIVSLDNTAGNTVVLKDNLNVDNLTLAGINAGLHLDPSAVPLVLTVNAGGTLANGGVLRVLDNDEAVTLTSTAGNTYSFTGNDIDYNGYVIQLGRLDSYGPAVNLGANEGIVLVDSSIFDNTLTVNGAGAYINIQAGMTLSTTGDALTLTNGSLTVNTGSTLDTVPGDISGAGTINNSGAVTCGDFTVTGTVVSQGSIACGNFSSTNTFTNGGVNTIEASGNVTISGSFGGTASNNTLSMSGDGSTLDTAVELGHFQPDVSGAGGTVILANNNPELAGTFHLAADTILDTNGFDFTIGGTTDLDGTLDFSANGATLTFGGDLDCDGTVNASGDGDIIAGGDVDLRNGAFSAGSGTFSLAAAGAQNLWSDGSSMGDVVITTAAVSLQDALSCTGLTIAGAGAGLTTGAFDLNVSGLLDCDAALDASGGGTVSAGGAVDFTNGAYTKGPGTFYFTGAASRDLTANAQDLGNVSVANTAGNIVVLTDSLIVDNLTLTGANAQFHLDPTAVPLILTINSGGILANNGGLKIVDNDDTITLTSTAGNTFAFTGNDIDYNGNDVQLGRVADYQPAVNLGAGEQISVVENSVFDNTLTINGAGAGLDIAAGITLSTSDDNVIVSNGTLTINTGGTLAAGMGAVSGAGTVVMNGIITCGNFNISGAVSSSGSLTCADFSSTNSFTNTGANTITASGNVVIAGTFGGTAADNTLLMTGDGTTLDAAVQIGTLQADVSGAGGTLSLSNNALNPAGNLSVSADTTLDAGVQNITPGGWVNISGILDFSANGIALEVSGDLTCTGSLLAGGNGNITTGGNTDFSGGTFSKGSGTFTLTGGVSKTFLGNNQDFGELVLADIAGNIVTLRDSLTADNLSLAGVNASLYLDPAPASPLVVTINAAGSLSNGGVLRISDNDDSVTLTSTAGNTFSFSGNDIDYNGNVIHLARLDSYTPAVVLGAGEGIELDQDSIFENTISINGAGAYVDIAAGISLTTTGDAIDVASGTLIINTGSTLDTGTSGVANAGSLTAAGTIQCGDFLNTGTVAASGAINCAAFSTTNTFNNITANTISSSGNVVAAGTFGGTATDNTLTVEGDSATINSSVQLGNLVADVTGAGGSISLVTNNLILMGFLTVAADTTFDMDVQDLTVNGGMTVQGILDFTANGLNLLIGGSLDCPGTLQAAGGNGVITARADVDFSSGTFNKGSGSFIFDSGGAQDISAAGGDLGNLQVATTGTQVNLLSDLSCDNLTIGVSTTLDIGGNSVSVAGTFENLNILRRTGGAGFNAADLDSGCVVYYGAAADTEIEDYGAGDYYDLEIETGTFRLPAGEDCRIYGNITLDAGTFDLNGRTLYLRGNFDNSAGAAFSHSNGTVDLQDELVLSIISGDNFFYNLFCTVPGKSIQFQINQRIDIDAAGGTFRILGSAGNYINLDSTDGISQWLIGIPAGANVDMQYVNLSDSNATPDAVIVPDDVVILNCTGWLNNVPVLNSWSLDLNANGKIDTIQVQVAGAVNLNDKFGDIVIRVNGYALAGRPYSANVLVDNDNFDDVFFFDLVEGEDLDTGVVPSWRIEFNNLLKDFSTETQVVSTGGGGAYITPIDMASPLIGYTLASIDRSEIFIRFSENVYSPGGGLLTLTDFTTFGYSGNGVITGFTPITTSGTGTGEVLLRLDKNITAAEVLNQEAITLTSLEDVVGNTLVSPSHRVTDIGIGLIGDALVEPVWAADETQCDPVLGGIGYISLFDSSQWLQDQDIVLQAHIHDGINGSGTPVKLHYDVDVPGVNVRNSLWLPPFNTANYNGLVPYPNTAARSLAESEISGQLRNFTVLNTDSEIADAARVEFFFEFSGIGLFCARNPIPAATDWYRQLTPWSFLIRDVRGQASQVTILNNVINPTTGDEVGLHYVLARTGIVSIMVFDLKGDIVDVLYRGRREAGGYSLTWDGLNRGNRAVARGVYFVKVVAPGISETRKVLVVK